MDIVCIRFWFQIGKASMQQWIQDTHNFGKRLFHLYVPFLFQHIWQQNFFYAIIIISIFKDLLTEIVQQLRKLLT